MARSLAVVGNTLPRHFISANAPVSLDIWGGRQDFRADKSQPSYGSGSRPLPSIHAHTTAVNRPQAPATSPIVLGPTYWDAIPAAAIATIMMAGSEERPAGKQETS